MFTIVIYILWLGAVANAITLPKSYDTVWTTQSNNSAGSMPVGGGDIGLNVWAEDGDILFYIAQSGVFDENNSLLKLGRVRLTMDPNPFGTGCSFEQRLLLNDGYAEVKGDDSTIVKIWVDVDTSDIHVEIDTAANITLRAAMESWRTSGYQMVTNEQQEQTSWGVDAVPAIPFPYQYPDTVNFTHGGVLSFHHNYETPLFDFQAKEQGLVDADSYYDPMRNNTLSDTGISHGKYLNTSYTAFTLASSRSRSSFQLYIGTAQAQTTEIGPWQQNLINKTLQAADRTQASSLQWWHDFWDRSYIIINPDAPSTDSGFQVGKNYQYFRYLMGCNAKGQFPTRFNGGLFTFDPVLTDNTTAFTPDYRRWSGGTFTAQNQRLLYWPLLKSGDFDIMEQSFNFYGNISPNSRKLGQLYFGLDVGLTTEQLDNTGLPNVFEYNANTFLYNATRNSTYPPGIDFNDYLSWLSDTANEFADMIVLAKSYGGVDIHRWMPFVEYQLAYFDEFYRLRNGLSADGELVLYPASGAETYKLALNPSSTVSGLRAVIADILNVDAPLTKGNVTYYNQYSVRVPQTPLQPCPGNPNLTCIAPAANYSFAENTEPTALYPVFPWGEYGLGQPTNLSFAYNAYFYDNQSASYHGDNGWRQDQIWWARMGLTGLAANNTAYRFADSTQYRFPVLKGPNYDWSPDINHYGSAAIGLQEMLLQTFAKNNTEIRLLPAWPADWNGYFKLLAPEQTVVSANMTNGKVSDLCVEPEHRMKNVVYGQE
ncbi:hypothetical protein LTR86_003853 [Recurvomyces mirabilis]|nr:hypothetical protein LTR86_003853 [Recurvomyces mirabilis]